MVLIIDNVIEDKHELIRIKTENAFRTGMFLTLFINQSTSG